jgi:uncharacterized membrane protein required for colicin V production
LNWAIDAVLVLIVAFSAWRGFKNGFIRGIFGLVALVVSIYGANLAATAFSGEFTGMLEPFVGGVIDKAISRVTNTDSEAPPSTDAVLTKEETTDVYNVSYSALRSIGVSEDASRLIAEKVGGEMDAVGQAMSDTLSHRLCQSLSFIVVFALAFALLAIIFAVIGNIFNLAFTIPGFALVNRLIGLVLGLAKGLVIVFVLAAVFRYAGFVSAGAVENTIVLDFLMRRNPIAAVLGV